MLIKDSISGKTIEIIEMELAEKSLKSEIISKLNKDTQIIEEEITDAQFSNICT